MAVFDIIHKETTWVITTKINDSGTSYYMRITGVFSQSNYDWVMDITQATRFSDKERLYRALANVTKNYSNRTPNFGVEQVETSVRTMHETTPYNYAQDVDIKNIHIDLLDAAVRKAKAVLSPAEYELLGISSKEIYVKLATHGVDNDA